jgi:hypothetical protein
MATGGNATGGKATGGNATGGFATGGAPSGGKATGGNASGGKATGGSGTGACSAGSPPSSYQQTIDLTWKEMTGGFEGETGARPVSASIATFKNTIIDMLMATNGALRYCVRWDSTGTLSAAQRDQIGPALERWINNWFQYLVGYDCWPYGHIPVTVTGYATRDRNLLGWTDTSFPDYYNWSVWAPGVAAPNTIMNAGASSVVTDWDSWMLRWEWSHIKGPHFGL